jgi:hypothetical protein
MPKMVSQLAQGNAFSRSADGGQLADNATRVWKIILNSPNEAIDIGAAVGVQIGDPYSDSNPIPCVSIEGRADGESRLVRIVTAQYRTNVGDDGGGQDPGTQSPEVRPANFSTSTTLYETPAYKWVPYPGGGQPEPVANQLGDPIDGVTKMEAITTIRITQFSGTPGTIYSAYCGYINNEPMSLGGYMSCDPHTVMFRGVEATPHVESFGNIVYRGFMNSYEFAFRANYVEGLGMCGWDATPLHTGFNVRAFNPAGARMDQDEYGQPLKYEDYKLKKPLALPTDVNVGDKVRAMVKIVNFQTGEVSQQPSAQPVALNEDGTPRDTSVAIPKVIIWRRQVQPDVNLTQTLQLRLT